MYISVKSNITVIVKVERTFISNSGSFVGQEDGL